MRICIITPGWLPVHSDFGAGGIEVHVQHLVTGLINKGHEITLITTRHPDGIKKEMREKLSVYYVGDRPQHCNELFYLESVDRFKELHEKKRFDIVHTQDYAGYGFTKHFSGIPHIITSHGTPINMLTLILKVKNYRSFPKIPYWIKSHFLVAPFIFQNADKIVAVSNELNENIKRQYKVPQDKVITIPNGIDIDRFNVAESSTIRNRLNIGKEKIILFIGGVSKQKGLHVLVDAVNNVFNEMKNVKLIIVGSGPYLQKIKIKVNTLKIKDNVIYIDKVPNKNLPMYYNLADIVVVPSLGMEGLPFVVIEAMSCGKPVIASDIGGIPTAIEHLKEGVLVEPGNIRELSDRILELLNDQEMAENLGRAGRQKAIEKFSLDSMVERTIEIYNECKS